MIRKFKNSDLNRVMDIWLETNLKAHDFINPQYWFDNYNLVKASIILPVTKIYVYEENDEILGFIGLSKDYLEGIFVTEKYQSKGIGHQLIEYVKKETDSIHLDVYKKNIRAIKFYLKEGFELWVDKGNDCFELGEYDEVIDQSIANDEEYFMIWHKNEV